MSYLLVLLGLMFGDIILTFYNVRRMQNTEYYKDKWMYYESNGLVVLAWKRFGFVKGTILAGITFPLILITLYFFIEPTDLIVGIWGGMYVIVYMAHLRWYDHLNDLKKKSQNKNGEKNEYLEFTKSGMVS